METNIPIYRAKKKDSNEYTEGFLYQDIVSYVPSDGVKSDEYNKALDEESWFLMDNIGRNEMIDITTLAIHFPDMVDSNGNKIFASLQEDGKGGDILDCRIAVNCDKPTRLKTIKYTKPYRFTIGVYDIDAYARKYITGIQE